MSRDLESSKFDLDGDLSLQGEELPVTYYGDNRFLNPEYEAAGNAVLGRYKGLSLDPSNTPSDQVLRYGIQYDAATGRLLAIDWPSAIAPVSNFYGYRDNSDLVNVSESRKAGTLKQHTDLTYHDNFNLPTSVVNSNGAAAVIAQADYEYDVLGRRTRQLLTGGHANVYGSGVLTTYQYNTRHELTGSQSFFSDPLTGGTQPIEGRALTWGYDNAGNRTAQKSSGARVAITDELTDRDVLGSISIHGTFSGLNLGGADPDSLAVRAETAAGVQFETPNVQGSWYHADVAVNNAGGPVSAEITVLAGKPSSNQYAQGTPLGKRFVPDALETFDYDADGNLTRDGRWSYEYDARNRLLAMETIPEAYGVGAARQRLEFDYDFLGRRVGKRVYTWDSGAGDWSLAIDLLFIYDGWNLIAEMDALNGNELMRTYYWGLDLSGTLQGAGGVGGLLMIRARTGGAEVDYYTHYDGNGNVLGLIDDSGAIAASYEYDPFGNLIRIDGPYAESNPFRFSTKYTDTETGLIYYGHRYYSPTLARFLNRDPIEEAGGLNLYAFVGNDPANRWDVLGLAPIVRPRVDGPTADRLPKGQTIHFSTRSRSILADRMAYGEDDDPFDPTNYDPRYGIAYGDPDYTIKVAAIERAWAAKDSVGSGSDGLGLQLPDGDKPKPGDVRITRADVMIRGSTRLGDWVVQIDSLTGAGKVIGKLPTSISPAHLIAHILSLPFPNLGTNFEALGAVLKDALNKLPPFSASTTIEYEVFTGTERGFFGLGGEREVWRPGRDHYTRIDGISIDWEESYPENLTIHTSREPIVDAPVPGGPFRDSRTATDVALRQLAKHRREAYNDPYARLLRESSD